MDPQGRASPVVQRKSLFPDPRRRFRLSARVVARFGTYDSFKATAAQRDELLGIRLPGNEGIEDRATTSTERVTDRARDFDERDTPPLRARVEAYERSILADTLRETGGNQSEAARRLGVTRSTLIEKLKRYGL
ncbi:MAG: helix-turn-helix domain-containing protein [Solirubrobacteraceae bacterium]